MKINVSCDNDGRHDGPSSKRLNESEKFAVAKICCVCVGVCVWKFIVALQMGNKIRNEKKNHLFLNWRKFLAVFSDFIFCATFWRLQNFDKWIFLSKTILCGLVDGIYELNLSIVYMSLNKKIWQIRYRTKYKNTYLIERLKRVSRLNDRSASPLFKVCITIAFLPNFKTETRLLP